MSSVTKKEKLPLIEESYVDGHLNSKYNCFPYNKEIDILMINVEEAIYKRIHPCRILQGSSGSYFVKNTDKEIIGVFKPKNEEPYGHMNPKWTKWIHRTCLPCCFGRGCIIPNQGYLSEVAASIVDEHFQLNIVPTTRVVWLISESFNYSKFDIAEAKTRTYVSERFPDTLGKLLEGGLPPKLGSFQLFVDGFNDAQYFLYHFENNVMSDELSMKFQEQFEKLVVLDYMIRNTDRGNDNWLIQFDLNSYNDDSSIKIAAIDNGLAFPFKHPDSWRAYPYHWAWLPYSKKPFSKRMIDHLVPKLSDINSIDSLENKILSIYKIDKGFNRELFERQMEAFRGQVYCFMSIRT